MAEIVEFRNEETIPELESMLNVVFETDELRHINSIRREHEYKMQNHSKKKEDCMNYIEFELRLLKGIQLRHKKSTKTAKILNLEYSLGQRINRMFILSIRWYAQDLSIWLAYIRFCRQMKFYGSASRVFEQMLELHGHSEPDLYKVAATWELNELNCIEKARKYLLEGIHVHKDSKPLLTEAFRLELLDADRKRKELLAKNMEIDPKNTFLTEKKAECIFECSIKKLRDVELLNNLIVICDKYDFANGLQTKIFNELILHEDNERMWDIIGLRELHHNTEDKLTPKAKIGKSVAIYNTAVQRLNTQRMWAYYLDALLELNKDTSVLPNYKRKLLLSALQKGAACNKLDEKYYLIWVSQLQGAEKHKKLVDMLNGAVKKLPDSVTLWHTLLRVHLLKGEERLANQVFDQGVASLTSKSLPLWKLMLQFEQLKRNNKVEDIFKRAWTQCPEITNHLKPMYLEWLVLTHGIAGARKAYDTMCNDSFPCLEMHKKMAYLESIQPNTNMRRLRQCYTIACALFGTNDVDVWMDSCKFEMTTGDPEKVSEIYWRARKNLNQYLVETFLSEFSLIHTIPQPSNNPSNPSGPN